MQFRLTFCVNFRKLTTGRPCSPDQGVCLNFYAAIILSTLLLERVVDTVADLLNLRNLTGKLPAEFKEFYDRKAYRKSQAYTRTATHFGFVTAGFDLTVMLSFWFSGGFNALDGLVRSHGFHPVVTGLIYIGILMLLRSILSLPFAIYGTFVIEERFGFNKTTPGTFVRDLLKSLALSVVLGGPLLAGMLFFFQYAGSWGWLAAWGGVTVFMLFIQFVAPTWIMPLFNKFTPLRKGRLKDSILKYTHAVKYPLAGVFVIDGSRRSTKSNAFFTGFGKNKRIALYDTLIKKHTVSELLAILAHEIGHYKKKHIQIGMAVGILHTGLVLFLLSLFLTETDLFKAFYMDQPSVYAGMLFFGMLYSPVERILSLGMHAVSRRHETSADAFAVRSTRRPGAFIQALKKLSVDNLSNLHPHPFYVFLHHSHPPVLQRIQNVRGLKSDIPGRVSP